jgi:hypothetical protein
LATVDFFAEAMVDELAEGGFRVLVGQFHLIERLHDGEPRGAA